MTLCQPTAFYAGLWPRRAVFSLRYVFPTSQDRPLLFVSCSKTLLLEIELFFRFAAGLILVVLISMVGIVLEKQTLEMNRAVSRQYFQLDMMLEMHAKLRLSIQELTAPALLANIEPEEFKVPQPRGFQRVTPSNAEPVEPPAPRLPLMRWQLPPRSVR